MNFNSLIKAQIAPRLEKYGIKLTKELTNILQFQSSVVGVKFAFNFREKSSSIFIGSCIESAVPLNDEVVKELWASPPPIVQVTPEKFVKNVSVLFEANEGAEILRGNIVKLHEAVQHQAEIYTSKLLLRQAVDAIDKIWNDKDYVAFIKGIEAIGVGNLLPSYRSKYKIAHKKL